VPLVLAQEAIDEQPLRGHALAAFAKQVGELRLRHLSLG
jgi:hypothetical protein